MKMDILDQVSILPLAVIWNLLISVPPAHEIYFPGSEYNVYPRRLSLIIPSILDLPKGKG